MKNLNEKLVLDYTINPEQKKMLFEAWKPHLAVVKKVQPNVTDTELVNLAVVLENTRRESKRTEDRIKRSNLYEATQVADIGGFKRFAFEIITGVLPNLVANEIVSVQALKQKVGQIFYLQYTYGSTKGTITAGDVMVSPFTGTPGNRNYSNEVVDQEIIASAGSTSTATLSWKPVRPGSVVLTSVVSSAAVEYTDDGNFNINQTGGSKVGTIDYTTGIITFTSAIVFEDSLEAAYEYNMEHAPVEAPDLELEVKEWIVTARTRKLRARYAFDAAYDLQMQHGIDIETELAETAVQEIKHEIDLEIINDLYTGATQTSSWNKAKPVGVSQRDHYESFVNEIVSASNTIFTATKRAVGNFIICGKLASDVIESYPENLFRGNGLDENNGPHVAGVLQNRWKVIKNPYFDSAAYLVGYKGKSFIDAGYVYAPYLPVFSTKMIMLDDFMGRQGFATSYAKKMVNNKFYVKGTITDTAEVVSTLAVVEE